MITGILKSITPTIFKPIIKITEAITSAKYGLPTNILPVNAQITPMTEKTKPVPITKNIICTSVFIGFSSEHPPTYPIINGNIDNEHGEIDEIKPPKKEAPNNIYILV